MLLVRREHFRLLPESVKLHTFKILCLAYIIPKMPTIEEVNDDHSGGASGDSSSGTSGSSGGGTQTQQGSAIQRVMNHMMSNKVAAGLWITRMLTTFFCISFMLPIFGTHAYPSYQKALISNAATSALRLHQRLPNFQLSREFFAMMFVEDSAHYLFYSIIFMNSSPITMVLLPIFLFALLHATTYTNQLLDQVGPGSLQFLRNLITKLKNHQTNILRFIAMNEIFMMPATILMIFTGGAFLLLPFIYYRFLSLRYSSRRNPYCRQIFYELRITVEYYAGQPNCPEAVRNMVNKSIAFISRLAPAVPT